MLPVLGQDPAFRVLEYQNGLPSNVVYNVHQDKSGYIWVAHEKGLSRFNGLSYKNYSSPEQKSKAVSNLAEDEQGRIYCQSFTGQAFYTQGDELKQNAVMSSEGNYVGFRIMAGRYMMAVHKGMLDVFDIRTGRKSTYSAPGEAFLASDFWVEGNVAYLYGAKRNALYKFENGRIQYLIGLFEPAQPWFFAFAKSRIYLFPSTGKGNIYAYDLSRHSIKKYNLGKEATIQNISYYNNKFWISSTAGVFVHDEEMVPQFGGQVFFPGSNVSKVMQDREGSMWFCTLNNGIFMIPNFKVTLNARSGVGFTTLTPYSKYKTVLVGSASNAIYDYFPQSGELIPVQLFQKNNEIKVIFEDRSNDLILVAADKLYGIKNDRIFFESPAAIKDIVSLGSGAYAMAAADGLYVYFIGSKADTPGYIRPFLRNKAYPKAPGIIKVTKDWWRGRCVAYDEGSRTLYGGTAAGFWVFSDEFSGPVSFRGTPVYPSDIGVSGGKAYVSTFNGRVLVFKGNQGLEELRLPAFLAGKTIQKVIPVNGSLWLLYDDLVLKYNLSDHSSYIYSTSDGLPSFEIRDICVSNDMVFLATKSGIVQFPANMASKNDIRPIIQLDKIFVNGLEIKNQTGKLRFSNSENNIQLHYDVLSYRGAKDLRVYYKINNGTWQLAEGNSRILNLASMSPGDYTVLVKSINEDGVESSMPARIEFSIAYPLWQRWWVVLPAILLAALGIYSYLRYRLKVIHAEAASKEARMKLEKELESSILSALKVQMNPHFIFNAMNTIQSYIYQNDKQNASQYLTRFSDLIRMILDMSTRDKISIEEEIRALTLYLELEKMRFEETFDFTIDVGPEIETDLMKIPSMLIQPYVENAVKHGLFHKHGDKRLKVKFHLAGNVLEVHIEDNGIGRDAARHLVERKRNRHKSFATQANQRRLELLNAGRDQAIAVQFIDKKDDHGHALGTTVVLRVPL